MSVAISNDAFVKDLFHCELFCHFKDEFTFETHGRLNETLLTTTQAEIFNIVSTVVVSNQTQIHNQM